MDDQQPKSPWASMGVWGGIIAIGGAIAGMLGYGLSAEDQAQLVAAASAIASGIGGLLAVWGRVRARRRVG